jgi:SAM-dependent methyltransferase
VFHFATEEKDRELYMRNLRRALKPGGHFILATFADDGPLKCSGLNVERYGLQKMIDTLGPEFELVQNLHEEHQTPFGTVQSFQYAQFKKRA